MKKIGNINEIHIKKFEKFLGRPFFICKESRVVDVILKYI